MTERLDRPDLNLDEIAAKTYSAVFSDVCDALGYGNQTVARRALRGE